MHHAHGRVGLVDVLAARAAGAKGVDAQIGRVEPDGLGLVGFGHHGHGAGAGVDAALGFGGGHALHAVAARFELQCAVNVVTFDAQHDFLVTPQLGRVFADDLDLPAHAVGVAHVHAREVARKQRRFITTRARPDFDKRVACVVGVFGQQQALQFVFELPQLGGGSGDFFLRHFRHLRVGQHLARSGQVGFALHKTGIAAGDLGDLRMFARQHAVLRHVGHDVFAREQKIQFAQTLRIAF